MKLMRPLLLVVALAASACPQRKDAIESIGGAPKALVDVARERLGKAEQQIEKRAAEAAVGLE